MVGTNLKAETMTLVEQRGAVEAEMNEIIQRLCEAGGPGLSGNLVDPEGFPRADVDVHSVRAHRHRLAELKNDHIDLTDKINQNIQLLHAVKPRPKPSTHPGNHKEIDGHVSFISNDFAQTSVEQVRMRNTVANIPFAMVDEITEASPAADDGLQLGDQIVKFGSVESGDNLLSSLASEVQTSQGRPIFVVLMRQGALMCLSVTPRPWQGRGLLGCHFKIL